MPDVDLLKRRLVRAVAKEKDAMTRLRRAQTIFDKRYASRVRLQEKLFEIDRQVTDVIKRLEHTK